MYISSPSVHPETEAVIASSSSPRSVPLSPEIMIAREAKTGDDRRRKAQKMPGRTGGYFTVSYSSIED
jgi:hypothetical protein